MIKLFLRKRELNGIRLLNKRSNENMTYKGKSYEAYYLELIAEISIFKSFPLKMQIVYTEFQINPKYLISCQTGNQQKNKG